MDGQNYHFLIHSDNCQVKVPMSPPVMLQMDRTKNFEQNVY